MHPDCDRLHPQWFRTRAAGSTQPSPQSAKRSKAEAFNTKHTEPEKKSTSCGFF
jgi:hypothetical protein